MRKVDAAIGSKASLASASRDYASLKLVCLALALALTTLLCRIASLW